MTEQDDLYVGKKALEEGLVKAEQLLECLSDLAEERHGRRAPRPLGVLLVQRGFLRQEALNRLLAQRLPEADRGRQQDLELGKLVIALKYASREQVEEALRLQAGRRQAGQSPKRLGEIMVEAGSLTPVQVQRLIAYHDKTIYVCVSCGTRFNVLNAQPGATYPCKKCGGTLEPAGPEAAGVANTAFALKAVTRKTLAPPAAPPAPPPSAEELELERAVDVYLRQKTKVRRDLLRQAEEFQEEAARYGLHAPILELLLRSKGVTWQQAEQIKALDFKKMIQTEAWKQQAVPGYRITDKLAAGGFATIFAAEPVFGGARVVLKLLHKARSQDPVSVKRFRREAALLMKFNHPHIVKAFDYGEYRGLHYITMELVDGKPLDHLVLDRKGLPPPEAVRVARQVSQALHYLQQEGYIHRDMKPENVLIDANGNAKLCDFGFAAEIREGAVGQSEVTLGTVGYVSPEQARGELNLKVGTDIYSLGLTLYFVLCAQEPFRGGPNSDVIMAERFSGGTVATPDFECLKAPVALIEVVKKMLHPERGMRYTTYPELIQALDGLAL